MTTPIHVVGISGSLRQESYNTAALRAAAELLPEGMSLEIIEIAALPFYDSDLESAGMPDVVHEFRGKIITADALLIATPEYNGSISGVLKNALEWASRPPMHSALNNKPLAIIGASTSLLGTSRAQAHLRQIAQATNMHTVNRPEVLIAKALDKFDGDGNLIDETSRQLIRSLLEALAGWTRQLSGESPIARIDAKKDLVAAR